jgi:hypothetical protein
MSTHPTEPEPGGALELPVKEQLARARTWDVAEQPVVGDLSDEEEADFLDAISS